MDANKRTKVIETLLDKASGAIAHEALSYTQAACNAANALRVLAEIERK